MWKTSFVFALCFVLLGCQLSESQKDVSRTIEAGQAIVNNQALKEAGQEVFDGSREIVAGGRDAAADLGTGAQKVIAGGKVILEETQAILDDWRAAAANEPQPTDGETVLIRKEDSECTSDEACFSWRENADTAWKKFAGRIENIDDLPAEIDNLKVQLSAMEDLLNGWNVEAILSTEGQ